MLHRVDIIVQSTQELIKAVLDADGLLGQYEMVDAYPANSADPLSKSMIVVSLSENDPARSLELGGPLVGVRRKMMIDVLAPSEAAAVNIVGYLTGVVFGMGTRVPFLDFGVRPPVVVDSIAVDNVVSNRNFFSNPRPWQEHWHSVLVSLEDEFNHVSVWEDVTDAKWTVTEYDGGGATADGSEVILDGGGA